MDGTDLLFCDNGGGAFCVFCLEVGGDSLASGLYASAEDKCSKILLQTRAVGGTIEGVLYKGVHL